MDDMKRLLNEKISMQEIDEAIADLDSAISKINERLDAAEAPSAKAALAFKNLRRKMIATTVSVFIAIASLTLCTFAYFTSSADSSGNTIASASSKVTLFDSTSEIEIGNITVFPGQSVERTVYAENEGAYPVYVRAKITSAIELDERYADRQNDVDPSLISYGIDTANWVERNGYYYYNSKLGRDQSTTSLLSDIKFSGKMGNMYKDSTIKIKILLETVQASNNGETVFDAVGWSSAEEGGTP